MIQRLRDLSAHNKQAIRYFIMFRLGMEYLRSTVGVALQTATTYMLVQPGDIAALGMPFAIPVIFFGTTLSARTAP